MFSEVWLWLKNAFSWLLIVVHLDISVLSAHLQQALWHRMQEYRIYKVK
jgi:hypothetical protein